MYRYLLVISILCCLSWGCSEKNNPADLWIDDYCIQKTALTQEEGSNTVSARIDGEWQEFKLTEFNDDFLKWNFSRRQENIEIITAMINGEYQGSGPELAGPHNGIVATCGYQRKDSSFKLNNAVKGMGFLPKREQLKFVIDMLEANLNAPMPVKLEKLSFLYEHADSLFAMDKQVSLELYANSEFMTQTFLNQMFNPVSTIVFLDIPSYKLKTVTRLLHPKDPDLDEYEQNVVKYINLIHSFFHGQFDQEFIAVIYYVVEIFDNSPRGRDPEKGMGRRVMPSTGV